MKKIMHISLSCLLFAAIACNDADNKAEPYAANTTDQAEKANETSAATNDENSDFFVKAATGGMMEVELGQMAQRNAASAEVKAFGNTMVTDHTKSNEELKTLAASRNVTLPAMVEGKHREHMNDLGKKTGAEFDRAYMDMMVSDHNETISLFEKASNSSDAAIKAFADKTLPTLRSHLDAAKSLHQQMKK